MLWKLTKCLELSDFRRDVLRSACRRRMKGNGNMRRSNPPRWYNLQIQTDMIRYICYQVCQKRHLVDLIKGHEIVIGNDQED
jgi:hypothetical protein